MKVQTKFYKQRGRIDVETPASIYPDVLYSSEDGLRCMCLEVNATGHGTQRMHMSIEEALELAKRLTSAAEAAKAANERDATRKAAKAAQAHAAAADVATVTEATKTAPAHANEAAEPKWRTYNLAIIGRAPETHANRESALEFVLRDAETPDNPYYNVDEENRIIHYRGKVYL